MLLASAAVNGGTSPIPLPFFEAKHDAGFA
jgi:hypothetical protein